MDSLCLFEVKESELDRLESGSPESPILTLAVTSGSVSATVLVGVVTGSIEDTTRLAVAWAITVALALVAIGAGAYWYKNRESLKEIFRRIRERVPTEAGATPEIVVPDDPASGEA